MYFAISAPSIYPGTIFILKSDGNLQPLSMGLLPWKGNTVGPIDKYLFGDIPILSLPPGIYYLYLAVTPAFSLDNYYLWTTYFVIQRDGGGGGGNGATTYDFVTKWGSIGSGDGQFMAGPLGLAVDSLGYVYVGGGANVTIQKFTSDGTFVAKFGSAFTISIDTLDNIYASTGYSIHKFKSDGTFLNSWSASGVGENQYLSALAIAVDSSSNVYVVDVGSNRIQKFNSNGSFITSWDAQDTGSRPFQGLLDIAVDSLGNIYVTENGGYFIQKFAPMK